MQKGISYFESIGIVVLFLFFNSIISFVLQYILMSHFITKDLFMILLIFTFIIPLFLIYLIYRKKILFAIHPNIKLFNYLLLFILGFFFQVSGVYIESFSKIIIPEKYFLDYSQMKEFLLPNNKKEFFFALITIGFIAPTCEELLFRGILLKGMLDRYHRFWISNSVQAILFGFAHLNPFQFLYAIPIGLILGYLYHTTRNLYFPVMAHVFTNSLALLFALIEWENSTFREWKEILEGNMKFENLPMNYFILSISSIFFIIFFIKRYNKKI